jgi:5-methylcytosine-specific restriction endonuclease McrA
MKRLNITFFEERRPQNLASAELVLPRARFPGKCVTIPASFPANCRAASRVAMMIDCDKNMIVHLLRNWRPNRLRPQGVRLAKERPRLITIQNGICPLCPKPLVNDGKDTHIDHVTTVKEFADKVLQGKLAFDEAYCRLWGDSNLQAVHRGCNYERNRKSITDEIEGESV